MQYPRVITLSDGKNETLFSVENFAYLIDRYMGFDALQYFRALLEERNEREDELSRTIADLKDRVHEFKVYLAEVESDFHEHER